MDKYNELVEQVRDELSWAVEECKAKGNLVTNSSVYKYSSTDGYSAGMLFAYQSILSKIESLEGGA